VLHFLVLLQQSAPFQVMTQYSLSEDISLLGHHTHDILPNSIVGVCKSSKGSRKKGPLFYQGVDGVKRG
jgi:hypothetical protein